MTLPKKSFSYLLRQALIKDCPCCKKRVIQPLDFKKYEPYQCQHCHTSITASSISVIGFTTTLLLLQHIFYQLDYDIIGHMVCVMMFFYWCFSTKIDAMLFPLIEMQE